MQRLIDADATIADLLTVDPQYETMIDWCCRVLEAQPTIDAVPVIRCKACRWFINKECAIYCLSSAHEETFCSYAESKEPAE